MCSGTPSAPRPTTHLPELESRALRLRVTLLAAVLSLSGPHVVSLAAQEATQSPAVVLGRVLDDETGEPIETVEVRLVGAVESLVRVTDGEGAFLFARVRPGTYEVVLEHLAYGTHTDSIEVDKGELVSYEARLVMEPIELAPLTVTVERRSISPMHLGFYQRMSMDMGGHFITREDIERRQPHQISQMIGEAPGTRVRCPLGRCHVIFARYEHDTLRGPCRPAVYLDRIYLGKWVLPENDIDFMVPPIEVEAVEVYDGPGSLPADFGGSRAGCGVVVIWTRRGT
ncbi:MAG: carboxypeptidase regulatory-like domain-containing protein [Gemmatimonadales bacterium]